ncbi:hypothetical protein [Alkalicoccus urumqiensis]|uniref:Lipoprotein n=1 Tax=Alkalicoccus urumqiensis TaxID=1548213 RepID=A0A2P6MJN8_ALKUR|nr:hypothetical protein [Alkalicoccus urumqiensis]PRO66481.1 hypothetical protein C6I21_03835 [Alkalicoccus urumqiensis]
MRYTLLFILILLSACSNSNDSSEESSPSYQTLLTENDGEYATYAMVESEERVHELVSRLRSPEYKHVLSNRTGEARNADDAHYTDLEPSGVPAYFVFDNDGLIFQTTDEEEFFSYLDDLSPE